MKIEYKFLDRMEIGAFADLHGLVMECSEHMPLRGSPYYAAHFKNTEVKKGKFLSSGVGSGATVEAAIGDYCRQIQGHTLVVDAMGKNRREIKAPDITTFAFSKDVQE